jgi:hypothetical protein
MGDFIHDNAGDTVQDQLLDPSVLAGEHYVTDIGGIRATDVLGVSQCCPLSRKFWK